jgi:hypothetical protein
MVKKYVKILQQDVTEEEIRIYIHKVKFHKNS